MPLLCNAKSFIERKFCTQYVGCMRSAFLFYMALSVSEICLHCRAYHCINSLIHPSITTSNTIACTVGLTCYIFLDYWKGLHTPCTTRWGLSPEREVTCGTVAIIIWVVLLSPHLCIRGVSLSFIRYNQSHCIYINWRQQYICLIWN